MGKSWEELSERMGLPAQALGVPTVTVTGQSGALIENHSGILEYSDRLVEVSGGRLRLRVRGEGLVLRVMTDKQLYISGRIFGVDVE